MPMSLYVVAAAHAETGLRRLLALRTSPDDIFRVGLEELCFADACDSVLDAALDRAYDDLLVMIPEYVPA